MRNNRTNHWFAIVAVLSTGLALSPVVSAYPSQMCKDIERGSVAACSSEVTKTCTVADAWQKKVCEMKLVAKHEQCGGSDFAKAAASARATLKDIDSIRLFDVDGDSWIRVAERIDAEAVEYARLHEQWKMCTGSFRNLSHTFNAENLKLVQGAPASLRGEYRRKVDYALDPSSPRDHAKKQAQRYIAINAKLPASFRYKDNELKAVIVEAEKAKIAEANKEKAEVAARGCPAGAALAAPFLAVVKAEFDGDKNVRRRLVRQTSARFQDRRGLISRDNVPATICTEAQAAGEEASCSMTRVTVYRERPPGGAWTSWMLAVGGGDEINCKKLK